MKYAKKHLDHLATQAIDGDETARKILLEIVKQVAPEFKYNWYFLVDLILDTQNRKPAAE